MKKVLMLLALLAVTGIASADLLTNGGFEDGDTGQINQPIPGWSSWGDAGWHHDDAGKVIDTKALKFWWDGAGLYQDVAVTPGETYDFSVEVFNASDDQLVGWNGLIKAEFYDGTGGQLLNDELERYYSATGAVDEWVTIGGSRVAPAGAVTGRIVLLIVDWQETGVSGALNFDNASIVPEPATMALLGLGGLLIRRRKA